MRFLPLYSESAFVLGSTKKKWVKVGGRTHNYEEIRGMSSLFFTILYESIPQLGFA